MSVSWSKKKWDALTDAQREFYRHKARWEHMSISAVMLEWPTTDTEARKFLGLARLAATARRNGGFSPEGGTDR